jgi:hypothetical protein
LMLSVGAGPGIDQEGMVAAVPGNVHEADQRAVTSVRSPTDARDGHGSSRHRSCAPADGS